MAEGIVQMHGKPERLMANLKGQTLAAQAAAQTNAQLNKLIREVGELWEICLVK